MLDHDLSYPEKKRLHCAECNGETYHHRQAVEWRDDYAEPVQGVVMRCRLCWNEEFIPAEFLDAGRLTQFVVRR